jgi:hypothetical protein
MINDLLTVFLGLLSRTITIYPLSGNHCTNFHLPCVSCYIKEITSRHRPICIFVNLWIACEQSIEKLNTVQNVSIKSWTCDSAYNNVHIVRQLVDPYFRSIKSSVDAITTVTMSSGHRIKSTIQQSTHKSLILTMLFCTIY